MSSYSFQTKLPSINITKDLLSDLESYILRKAEEITGEPVANLRSRYGIVIEDSLGEERLSSVADFRFSYYPDDTRAIVLAIRADKFGLEWKIAFMKDGASFKMFLRRDDAREIIHGIHFEIVRVLKPYRNSHWVFNIWYTREFSTFFGVMAFVWILIWGTLDFYFKREIQLDVILGLAVVGTVFGAHSVIGNLFKPYCLFPTLRNERNQRRYKWFVLGVLAFLIFNVGGYIFESDCFISKGRPDAYAKARWF